MKKITALFLFTLILVSLFTLTGVSVFAETEKETPTPEELQQKIETLEAEIAHLTEEIKSSEARVATLEALQLDLSEKVTELNETLYAQSLMLEDQREEITTLYVMVAIVSVISILLYSISAYENKKKGKASSDANG